ncbi:uncharacterized protein LOC135952513 [Calliphora vicina]|uniref:uncharacterized protein LOC135952513 n=1 Tax=Calliphora vicina TaxID=7373 RepID=UPI00325C21C7
MLLKIKILTLFILASFYLAKSNALDISTATSLFTTKHLKCYKCSSLLDDDCKNKTNVIQKSEFVEQCASAATGCVKQLVTRYDGKKATFRECYYGSISSLYTSFDCENISRNRQYDVVECHKCKGDLCNSSTRLSHSTYGNLFVTLIVMLISVMLKM